MATDEVQSTIVQDIPPVTVKNVKHVAPVRCCGRCGRRTVAKLPGAVQSGSSVAKVQLGPNALGLALSLRFERKVPLAGIAAFLSTWFDLQITPGGLSQLFARWGVRSSGNYEEIRERVRASAVAGADETGLRQNGASGYATMPR